VIGGGKEACLLSGRGKGVLYDGGRRLAFPAEERGLCGLPGRRKKEGGETTFPVGGKK